MLGLGVKFMTERKFEGFSTVPVILTLLFAGGIDRVVYPSVGGNGENRPETSFVCDPGDLLTREYRKPNEERPGYLCAWRTERNQHSPRLTVAGQSGTKAR